MQTTYHYANLEKITVSLTEYEMAQVLREHIKSGVKIPDDANFEYDFREEEVGDLQYRTVFSATFTLETEKESTDGK